MKIGPGFPQAALEKATHGVTLAEYALILAAVGIVGISGLTALKVSTVNLYHETDRSLVNGGTLGVLTPIGEKAAGITADNGYYRVNIDSLGQASLQMVESGNGGGANVSSIEGSQINSLGTTRLATTLDELAAEQTDPALKNYYQELAYYSYYMAGAEGELDNIPGLEIAEARFNLPTESDYTKGNALQDLYTYRNKMDQLLKNPPAGIDHAEFSKVVPLAADTFNIAQTYLAAFKGNLDSNGKAKGNINLSRGNGKPGSSLEGDVSFNRLGVRMIDKRYDQLVNIQTMRTRSRLLMQENKVGSVLVKTTLENAVVADEAAGDS